MAEKNENLANLETKLDKAVNLLQLIAAVQLYQAGASKDQIRKNLKMKAIRLSAMLKGVGKE